MQADPPDELRLRPHEGMGRARARAPGSPREMIARLNGSPSIAGKSDSARSSFAPGGQPSLLSSIVARAAACGTERLSLDALSRFRELPLHARRINEGTGWAGQPFDGCLVQRSNP